GIRNMAVYQCLIAYIFSPGIAPERKEVIDETTQDHQAATWSQDQDQRARSRYAVTTQRDARQSLITRRPSMKKPVKTSRNTTTQPPGLKIKTKVRAAGIELQHNQSLTRV